MNNPPTIADLFRLDDMEGIARRSEGDTRYYLFRLDGLLPGEQRLAIDVISGLTRVCTAGSEQTTMAETHLDEMQTRLFTALVLSHPCGVAKYQMRALYQLPEGIDVKGQRARAVQEDGDDRPLRDVITACNLKLVPLALAITPTDHRAEYQLTRCLGSVKGE